MLTAGQISVENLPNCVPLVPLRYAMPLYLACICALHAFVSCLLYSLVLPKRLGRLFCELSVPYLCKLKSFLDGFLVQGGLAIFLEL